MTVEASKGSEGGFSGFFKRLLALPLESQHIQQITPKIVQPPLGLENFADMMESVVDGCFAAQRQKELDIEIAKVAQIAADADAKIKAAQSQIDPEQQERARAQREEQERIAIETSAILTAFRVVDRLQCIKDAVWGGMGEIRPCGGDRFIAGKKASYTYQNYAYNWSAYTGGIELVYSYPVCKCLHSSDTVGSRSYFKEQYVQSINSTTLRVSVLNTEQDSGEDKKELNISAVADVVYPDNCDYDHETYQTFTPRVIPIKYFDVNIPRDTEESEALLATALQQEVIRRIDNHYLPLQLEEPERKKLAEAQRRPNWQKWKRTGNFSDYYPNPCFG